MTTMLIGQGRLTVETTRSQTSVAYPRKGFLMSQSNQVSGGGERVSLLHTILQGPRRLPPGTEVLNLESTGPRKAVDRIQGVCELGWEKKYIFIVINLLTMI